MKMGPGAGESLQALRRELKDLFVERDEFVDLRLRSQADGPRIAPVARRVRAHVAPAVLATAVALLALSSPEARATAPGLARLAGSGLASALPPVSLGDLFGLVTLHHLVSFALVATARARALAAAGRRTEARRRLLRLLGGIPKEKRTAHFRCVIAVTTPDGAVRTVEGRCEGHILEAPRGGGGFGYDPLFLVPALNLTFAELPPDKKNRISHRGRALEGHLDRGLALLLGRLLDPELDQRGGLRGSARRRTRRLVWRR